MTPVDVFVDAVETHMRVEIARTPVAAPARRLLDAGGKRLRARLLWSSANASATSPLAANNPRLIRAATAIEFAHLGSLIHDDIVDGSDTRRGVATLHREYGVRVATDAGAALAHLANELVAPLGDRARRAVRRALLATCRGQVRELAVPFVVVSPRRRLAIMQEKTGAFFELAATLGALIGGGDRRACTAVRRFARRFGVAFQIADDVLDLTGDPRELGRANGADLRDGVMTLPVVLTSDPDHALQEMLVGLGTAPDADAIGACAAAIRNGGGLAAAAAVATWWLERAIDALGTLRPNDDVTALIRLARTSVARGLRAGTPSFIVPATDVRRAAAHTAAPFIGTASGHASAAPTPLDDGLHRVLEWYHRGLASMVAARAHDPAVDATRRALRERLRRGVRWSDEAWRAADAIALAYALADETALHADPVRTLAMVDALHCAAIAFLTTASSAREHERMAARARNLFAHPRRSTAPLAHSRVASLVAVASPA